MTDTVRTLKRDLSPLRIGPFVYGLPALAPIRWNWCRLGEVYETASGLIKYLGGVFNPAPQDFVNAFALLARPTRWPTDLSPPEIQRKRLFRYALPAGDVASFVEIPEDTNSFKTRPFKIDLHHPCTNDLFVPDGWAIDALKLVRYGAVRIDVAWVSEGERLLVCRNFDDEGIVFNSSLDIKIADAGVWKRIGR